MKISLPEAIRVAVKKRDGVVLGKCVDVLRFHFSMNYAECFAQVNRLLKVPLTEAEFEAFMYEADCEY